MVVQDGDDTYRLTGAHVLQSSLLFRRIVSWAPLRCRCTLCCARIRSCISDEAMRHTMHDQGRASAFQLHMCNYSRGTQAANGAIIGVICIIMHWFHEYYSISIPCVLQYLHYL